MGYQFFMVMAILLSTQAAVHSYFQMTGKDDKCELLSYGICRQMEYNRTIFPNYLGHRKQSEAILSVNSFRPLLKIGCSSNVLTFLCSVYFPMCTSLNKPIPPCQEMCLDVEKGCSPIIKRFGYVWPKELKCDQFPKVRTDICVFQNKTGPKPTLPTTFNVTKTIRTTKGAPLPPRKKHCLADKMQKKKKKSKSQKNCCKCCNRGNRAARGGISKCTLKKTYSKEKSFLKTLKECTSRKSKRCYLDCCNAKRKEIQAEKKKGKNKQNIRRNKNRRNRNRKGRKRPVG